MFSKVLYPTDFSQESHNAIDCIFQLKPSGLREVVVLHVNDLRSAGNTQTFVTSSAVLEARSRTRKENELAMQKIAGDLQAHGIATKIVTRTGIPIEEILAIANEENVTAIVMGSHIWTRFHRLFSPSVSESVVHKSKRPVIVVKREDRCELNPGA